MTYPDTPGYQAHSETSKEAADKLNAGTLRAEILDRIELGTYFGRTADELSMQFDTPQSTIGARLRELELADQVVKTKMKRKTRYDRNAFVYVHPDHFRPVMGRATVKEAKSCDIIKLEAEHARYKKALERIACFTDKGANEVLEACGSYGCFDEPGSVQVARRALGHD